MRVESVSLLDGKTDHLLLRNNNNTPIWNRNRSTEETLATTFTLNIIVCRPLTFLIYSVIMSSLCVEHERR